jgi:elongation factor G
VQNYSSDKIRNVVLLSHSGAGKSSLAEALLFTAGATTRLGKVSEGTSLSDFEPEETKRKISLNLSILPCEWKGNKINLMDPPGYPDFVFEVKAGIRVSESAVFVICAASGVEVGTELTWDYANSAKLPGIIFINKMDRENANFFETFKGIQTKLGSKCLPIQLPIGASKDFQGYVDLITKKAYTGNPLKEGQVPANMSSDVDTYRDKLVEAVVEIDDELITKYLDGESISEPDVYKCLKKSVAAGKVVPILCGSALTNLCITSLLDAINDYLPSPVAAGPVKVTNTASGKEETIDPKAESPLTVFVFKTTSDPRVGKINYFKVMSGEFNSNSQIWNISKNGNERIGQLFMIRGKTQEPVTKVGAGDIGAVTKLAVTGTCDSLGAKERPYTLAPIDYPEPVFCLAVNPKSKADLDKMSSSLPRICEEDLTLKTQRDSDTGELLLCGIGETHLEVAAEKILRKFGVDIALTAQKVSYKETITMKVEAEYKHKKQTGGHGQYGHVLLELEPLPRGTGFEFAERVVGGSVPRNYIPAVEKGIMESKGEGVLAKCPIVDIRVTLFDGSSHPVDSSEMAFKIASSQALKKGLQDGKPVLLEPVMNMTIVVPDSFTGDIISDLNSKGARVMGMNPTGGMNIIQAQAPQASILRYAIDLRSITQGRGTFKIEFNHYQEVPPQNAQKIIAAKEAQQQQ